MQIWELMFVCALGFAGWVGLAHAVTRNTERRLIDLALDLADGVLEEEPLEVFHAHWTPRYEAALNAIGLVPTRGQWLTVFARVREHVVAYTLARSKRDLGAAVVSIEAVLTRLRLEEDRTLSS